MPASGGDRPAVQVSLEGAWPQGVDCDIRSGAEIAGTTQWVWRLARGHVTRPPSLRSERRSYSATSTKRARDEARL